MDAILLFGACSAAESLGKILFTPAVGSSTNSNSGSNSSIDIGSFCKDDASASSSDAEFEFEIDETPEADEISVVPVCGDGGDESSTWRIVVSRSVSSKRQQKRRRRQRRRRSVRFSKPSALDTIVAHAPTNPYPCCASTYASTASTHTNTTATGTATATPSMIVSPDRTSTTCSSSSSFDDIIGITDLFGPEDSLPTPSSTPSIEVTLGIVDASFSSSASSSFDRSRSRNNKTVRNNGIGVWGWAGQRGYTESGNYWRTNWLIDNNEGGNY
eukprot:jgi/Psemu1/70397/estExt_Genemark1.C_19890003